MAGTFLKTTIRSLYREKIYAAINIAGLSLAIACCIILGIYLRSELTYDMHHNKYKKIYRVVNEYNVNGKLEAIARTAQLLGPMLKDGYDEVEDFVRIMTIDRKVLLKSGDQGFYWGATGFASKNFFDVFHHDFIYGDPEKIKTERFAAVSETFAKKYWGNENPVGKTISSEGFSVKITHVFADLPSNTHLKYDLVQSDDIPFFAVPDNTNARLQRLVSGNWYTYLIMPEDYDINKFKEISDSFFERQLEQVLKPQKIIWRAWLQPLADIHYNSDVAFDEPTGNRHYLYGFMAVAIFILLVACINYMNLSTARAAKRAKEIGMRKILGSGRWRLIFQFLGESVFFSLIALLVGYALVQLALALTPISGLLGNSIALTDLTDPYLIGWMLLFSVTIGLLSGIYPAFFLSSVAPLTALVGTQKTGKGSIKLRQLLVLIQFIISVTVIACTLFMAIQMHFISNMPLGFEKENRVFITLRTADVIDKVPTIKTELLKNSSILGVSMCNQIIGKVEDLVGRAIENDKGIQEVMTLSRLIVAKDFIKVMGLELLEGRDFSKRLITDVGESYLVNQKMVQKMGWDQPLGKKIQGGKVIGVVKDFHYASLHQSIEPFMIDRFSGTQNQAAANRDLMIFYMVVNVSGDGIFKTLQFLEDKFAEFDPKHPFEFEFLDDSLNKVYLNEQRLMSLTGTFSGVCIFISCMGLFGLAAFTTEQRTKEIGIRKVLGATTWQIITMLAMNILLLVICGAVVASLIAYYSMEELWLADFAYRISMNANLWVFLVAAAVAAAVAFITVAMQSFRTAQANPINAIRYE